MIRNRHYHLLLALFIGGLLQIAAPVWAADDPPAAPQTPSVDRQSGGRLVIVPQEGVNADGTARAYRDFGTIDALTTKRLEQTFHLRNDGQSPIFINYIQPSCGCASVVLSAEGSRDPYKIAPGAQVAVHVSVDLNRVHSGQISKLALVYVKGNSSPAFTLEMRGDLPSLVSYSPQLLNFGRLDAGVGRVLTLTVTVDKRLFAASPPPKLICNNPDIQITLQTETPPTKSAPQSGRTVTQSYTLTLARNARLGIVGGGVAFVPGDSPTAKSLATPYGIAGIISDAVGGASAIISGQIIGKLSATPYLAIFGSVLQGREATRQIHLVATTQEILQDLTLSCSLPTMSARLVPSQDAARETAVQGNNSRPTVLLEIKLDGQTPVGGLSGEVVVTAKDGERLVISVIGDVIKAP